MAFVLEDVINEIEETRSLESLKKFKKENLVKVAVHYGITPAVGATKSHILNLIKDHCVENDIIEESQSNWSSPCILVPKHDGGFRFCTDFRKVNDKTKSDSFPIPRIADCIDQIGNAKFVSTFDMLKGYWQVPLTQ